MDSPYTTFHLTNETFNLVVIVSRGSLITVDSTLIALTWWKLFHQVSFAQVFSGHTRTLSFIFLRDGTCSSLQNDIAVETHYGLQ